MTCLQVSTAPTASSSVVQPLPTQSSPIHSTPFAPPLPLPPTSPAQASSPLPADVCPGLRHANRLCFYLPSPIHFPFPLTFPHFTTLHFLPLFPPFSPCNITPSPPGVHPGLRRTNCLLFYSISPSNSLFSRPSPTSPLIPYPLTPSTLSSSNLLLLPPSPLQAPSPPLPLTCA
ncbi:unnamed protein product [Closterium sp. NIES-54]